MTFANMWGHKCFFNSLCSNARGIAVLIKDTLDINKILWQNMIKGNFSRLTFVHKEQRYLIKCLYAPNKDSVESDIKNERTKFLKEVFDDENG